MDLNEERLIAGNLALEDQGEESLRPKKLSEYIGQAKIKENLQIYIQSAKLRGESLDHVLLYGPPGLGKTTLASIIAVEMGVNIKVTSGPALEKVGDIVAILANLQDGDVLFIDEIHRINRTIEETLYPAMEDFKIDIMIGSGPSARSLPLDLPKFTLIGATTRAGLLTSPLRDRFGMLFRLDLYNDDELFKIITRSSRVLGVNIDKDSAFEIARRSRGTPRICNRLLKRVRDYALVKSSGNINIDITKIALNAMEIDELGLDKVDRNLLLAIIDKFSGGPVGLDTISACTGEESTTIEDVYEPFLMQIGFLNKTPRGRMATKSAYDHIGIPFPT